MTAGLDGGGFAFPEAELRRVATASLIQRSAQGDPIGNTAAAEVARLFGRSARTVYRDIARGGYVPQLRARYRIEDEELTVLFIHRGNRRPAHTWLTDNFWPAGDGPGLSQFYRAVKLDVHPSTWAAMKDGDRAARQFELMLVVTYERPYELLSMDAKQVSVFIQHSSKRDPLDRSKPLLVQPWVFWAKDAKTKAITGVAASEDALTHRGVLRVLQQSVRGNPELGPFRGRPEAVAWDRATIHTADAVTMALSALVIPVHISDAYQPHQNGLIESFNALAESDFAAADPFHAHPPIQIDGRPILPDTDYAPTFAHFNRRLLDWVAKYNAEWKHSALGGHTPLAAWNEAESKPGLIPEEWLRFLHLDSRKGRVIPNGVRVDSEFFTAPELDPLIKRVVDIRYSDDRRSVEVFDIEDGTWLCTAINHEFLTAKQKQAVKAPAKVRRRKVRQIRHGLLSSQEEAAKLATNTPVGPSEADEDLEDAVADAAGRVQKPGGTINQPIEMPDHLVKRIPKKRRTR